MCSGKDGTEIPPPAHRAMVGKNSVGWIHTSPWTGNDGWAWQVYQPPMGHVGFGVCTTLEPAKAEVEKHIERWFRDCGIDRSKLG